MELINLTTHDIRIISEIGETIQVIKSSGLVVCNKHTHYCNKINGIPIVKIEYDRVVNMPEQRPGVGYIVTIVVAEQLKKEGRTEDVSSTGS